MRKLSSSTLAILWLIMPGILFQPHSSSIVTAQATFAPPSPNITVAPTTCAIETQKWCPPTQSCFISQEGFQCKDRDTHAGWTIISDLHLSYHPPLPPNRSICSILPLPTNDTLKDIMVLAMKRYGAYYRTSTLLVSNNPLSILTGVNNCPDTHERCIDEKCVPTLNEGEICVGNADCFNPASNTSPAGNPARGLICEYQAGKLHERPKCIHYIQVPDRPDNDPYPPILHPRKNYTWVYIVVVAALVVLGATLLWFCRKSQLVRRRQRELESGSGILPCQLDDDDSGVREQGGVRGGEAIDSGVPGLTMTELEQMNKEVKLEQQFQHQIGHRRIPTHRTEQLCRHEPLPDRKASVVSHK